MPYSLHGVNAGAKVQVDQRTGLKANCGRTDQSYQVDPHALFANVA